MSYLLTEIALEMLGFKFYNIHGEYQLTDFTTDVKPPKGCQEPDLETALGLKKPIKVEKETEPTENEHNVIEIMDESENETEEPSAAKKIASETIVTNPTNNSNANSTADTSNLSSKLLTDEMTKLNEEFMRHKIEFMLEGNNEVIIDGQPIDENELSKCLQSTLSKEKKSLRENASNMETLYNNLEKTLEKMDGKMFQKYKAELEKIK